MQQRLQGYLPGQENGRVGEPCLCEAGDAPFIVPVVFLKLKLNHLTATTSRSGGVGSPKRKTKESHFARRSATRETLKMQLLLVL